MKLLPLKYIPWPTWFLQSSASQWLPQAVREAVELEAIREQVSEIPNDLLRNLEQIDMTIRHMLRDAKQVQPRAVGELISAFNRLTNNTPRYSDWRTFCRHTQRVLIGNLKAQSTGAISSTTDAVSPRLSLDPWIARTQLLKPVATTAAFLIAMTHATRTGLDPHERAAIHPTDQRDLLMLQDFTGPNTPNVTVSQDSILHETELFSPSLTTRYYSINFRKKTPDYSQEAIVDDFYAIPIRQYLLLCATIRLTPPSAFSSISLATWFWNRGLLHRPAIVLDFHNGTYWLQTAAPSPVWHMNLPPKLDVPYNTRMLLSIQVNITQLYYVFAHALTEPVLASGLIYPVQSFPKPFLSWFTLRFTTRPGHVGQADIERLEVLNTGPLMRDRYELALPPDADPQQPETLLPRKDIPRPQTEPSPETKLKPPKGIQVTPREQWLPPKP